MYIHSTPQKEGSVLSEFLGGFVFGSPLGAKTHFSDGPLSRQFGEAARYLSMSSATFLTEWYARNNLEAGEQEVAVTPTRQKFPSP